MTKEKSIARLINRAWIETLRHMRAWNYCEMYRPAYKPGVDGNIHNIKRRIITNKVSPGL